MAYKNSWSIGGDPMQQFMHSVALKFLPFVVLFGLLIQLIRKYHQSSRIPFPGPPVKSFLSGNLDELLSGDIVDKWRSWHITYGPVFQTMSGPFSRTIYVGDPVMIAEITNANWPKADSQYKGFKPLVGNALFAQTDHVKWQKQRKGLAPAFGPGVINGQLESLQNYLSQYLEILDRAVLNQEVIDFSSLNVLLTLDFIGEVAFGINLHALENGKECRIAQIFSIVLPELMKCGLFPLRAKIPICKSTRKMHRAIAEIRGMATRAVTDCRSEQVNSKTKPSKKMFDIITRKVDAKGAYVFSTSDLVDNYVGFLLAGGDPTAHTITFAIYEIMRQPSILRKLQAELDTTTAADCTMPSLEQVKLPYLNMIIKETMRFNGPGFGTFRYCKEDTEVNGVVLPANTTLALWNPQVHRDPKIWGSDANEFNPERWADGKGPPQPGSYFPFSTGPRNCLGQGLSMLEISLTLAILFHRYDFTFQEGFVMEYAPNFAMCAKNGLHIKLSRRMHR